MAVQCVVRKAAGVALLAVILPHAAAAQPRNVLVIEAGAAGRPLALEITAALAEALTEAPSDAILTTYYEWLDLDRFEDPAYVADVRAFLTRKYRQNSPDVLLALGDPAIRLILEWRHRDWPDVPLVFVSNSDEVAALARRVASATGVVIRLDLNIDRTLRAALAMFPDTDEVVLVSSGDIYRSLVEQALQTLPAGVHVRRIGDRPIDEIRATLAALPARSLIFYSGVTRDGTGRGFVARNVLEQLRPVANRPMFSFVGSFLGYGIVGGALTRPAESMHGVAQMVARVAGGAAPESIEIVTQPPGTVVVDARELRRWGIDEARVPAGSEIRFRERNLFEEYRGTITAVAAVLAAQAISIVALLYEVRRRREAQAQQRRLGVRVLSAQEDERSRIARELHDGASQQMALVAIELDQLDGSGAATGPDPIGARALADRVRDLSSELHDLAYELHPAILDKLGLVPALQQFADRFAKLHGIRVDVRDEQWPTELPNSVDLTFYRVAQEALQNVAKHSGGASATVTLRASPKELTLTIVDVGHGFDVAAPHRTHLGLAGMRERLEHIGGQLAIDSASSHGTTVTASVSRATVEIIKSDERLSRQTNREVTSVPRQAHV